MFRLRREAAIRGVQQVILHFLQTRSRDACEMGELPAPESAESLREIPRCRADGVRELIVEIAICLNLAFGKNYAIHFDLQPPSKLPRP